MAPPRWLPDDLIREILSRTPVKSLCRFRCVSKEWNALISDPAFVAAHRCPDFLVVGGCLNLRTGNLEIKVMDMDDGKVLRVMDIADDHWSLRTAIEGTPHVDLSSGQMVDLATGQVLAPCRPELRRFARCFFTVGRVAAPPCTYKAVHIAYDFPPTCMILTPGEEDAEWRAAPLPPDGASIIYSSDSGVTLNGVMHFLSAKNTPPHPLEEDNHDVLCFDLESETWTEMIDGPPAAGPSDTTAATTTRRETILTNLDNTLCMSVTHLRPRSVHAGDGDDGDHRSRTDVWLLHGGAGSWTKAYSFLTNPLVSLVRPLRVITGNDGRSKLLFGCISEDCVTSALRVYDPLAGGEACTDAATKLPSDIWGRVGICRLHLKHAVPNLYLTN